MEKNVTRMSDEIQHLNRDITIRMKNVVTNETLEKSFKTTGRDTIVRALQDTQKDISNDVEKVRNNVEEVSKSVNALSTRMSNEIQRGIPDLHQQIYKTVTEEMLKTNEIQRGVIDMRQRINNTVTKETLEKSLKTTGRDTIVHALQDMQKDMSNDVKKVRDNVEEVLKGVNALSTRVSDEIHRGVTDLRQRMNNIVTKETLERNAILALQKVSDESQRLNRNVTYLRQQANDTKDTLVRLFKNDRERDTIVLALQKVSDESQRLNRNGSASISE